MGTPTTYEIVKYMRDICGKDASGRGVAGIYRHDVAGLLFFFLSIFEYVKVRKFL